MKNAKPCIAVDILILLAFVVGINGGLLANYNPTSPLPQKSRQALIGVDSTKYAYIPLAQELEALEKYCSLESLSPPFQYSPF